MTAEEIKERIVALRKAQGLSQKELAKKSKLTQSTVSTMEHSNFYPSMYSFLKVCRGLDISPAQFFMSEDEAIEVFTEHEYDLLNLWNCLNGKNRKFAFDIMTSLDRIQNEPDEEFEETIEDESDDERINDDSDETSDNEMLNDVGDETPDNEMLNDVSDETLDVEIIDNELTNDVNDESDK